VDAFFLLMASPDDFTGPVNLGSPNEFTILDLAKTIIKLAKSSSEIVFGPLPHDDPLQRKPDISLAKSKLGWETDVKLKEGLLETIGYF